MSARETIENLWDRATPVAPLLDAFRAEVLREAADELVKKYGVTNRAAGTLRRLAELEAQKGL